jgi:hypothetical protein
LKDGALVLSRDQETCGLRAGVLEAHPWIKQ